jgi:hypothetical protein
MVAGKNVATSSILHLFEAGGSPAGAMRPYGGLSSAVDQWCPLHFLWVTLEETIRELLE